MNGDVPKGSWTRNAANELEWQFKQDDWQLGRGPMGDMRSLRDWTHMMSAWGTALARKCAELEARIAELEKRGK